MLSAPTKGADGDSHLARTRGVPARHGRGKRIYVDPFLTGNPKTPESREDARARRRDRGHARPRRPRRRHRRALEAVPRRARSSRRSSSRSGSASRARTSATLPGLNKGGTQEIDGITLHARRTPSTRRARPTATYAGEACGLVIRLEDGKSRLLRRRHLRLRRHAADRAPLQAATSRCCRSATTSRWAREEAALALELLGNPRCVPCHWGTFPLLTGTPEELAELTSAKIERDRARGEHRAVRERWFGATGRRVPEIALAGDLDARRRARARPRRRRARCAPRMPRAGPSSCAPTPPTR